MATSRVAELRNVMDKFGEFYHQKLCESEEIPAEPMRTKAKCRVLEHYMDDVKMQIEHFLTCVEKWDVEGAEKMDRLKRTIRDHGEKAEFLEKQLRNSESQREQVELALQELGVRCETLEKSQRHIKSNNDNLLNEISRLTDAITATRNSGKFSEVGKCQKQSQQAELARLIQAIISLNNLLPTSPNSGRSQSLPRRSFGTQSELLAVQPETMLKDEELANAKNEINSLNEKLREVKSTLNAVSQREQDLLRELHNKDREVAHLKILASDNNPARNLQHRLDVAEKERSEWKAQADLYLQQLTKALEDLGKSQSERSGLTESESTVSYLQREFVNERERADALENSIKDREKEVEMYCGRYKEVMEENDRLESLLSERQIASAQQENVLRNIITEREDAILQLRQELVHVASILKEQRDKANNAEEQVRTLTIQLDAIKALKDGNGDGENSVVNTEQFFARQLAMKTQELADSVRKLEMQLEMTRHEKIVVEEEFARLKARSSAEQTALQNHVDRIKDELRAHEQAANKVRSDMRLIWEEKLRTEQQMREILDTQAVDRERNKSLSTLLQQREEEASSLRNQVAVLSEQLGEKDGVISQLRSEIAKFDEETLALQRDAENTCELVRVRDNQLVELKAAFDRSCEAGNAAKQELQRCESSMKRMADELAEWRQKAADARVEAERERTRAMTSETQATKIDSERMYIDQQLSAAEAEVSRLRNEVIELNERIVALDKDYTEIREAHDRLQAENFEIAQAADIESKERRKCESKLGDLEMTAHMLEEQLQAYRQDVAVRDQAILRLRAETDQAIARCQAAQEELETKDTDIRRVAQRARDQQLELRQTMDNLVLMEERLACAEARITEVSQEREIAIQEVRNTENVIDQMKRDILLMRTEHETETNRLKQTGDLLAVERDAARADCSELSQRLEHAREEILALSRSGSEIQVELHQMTARCRQADLLISEQNSLIAEMRQRLSDSSDELERMRDDERQANMELETLRERCANLSERLASSEAKADELDRQNGDMKCRIADLETIVVRMEADLQQARIDTRNSKQRQTELELAIIQMKDIIDNERSSAESVAFRLQAEEIVSGDLKDKFQRVCQDNSVLEESYSRLLADFRCYETDHRFTNEDIADRDKKIEELETKLDTYSGDMHSAQRKIEQLESMIDSLKADLQGARDDRTNAADELKLLEEKLTLLRQESEAQNVEWENTVRTREKEIDELRRHASESNADVRVLREEADVHLERIHALEIDIAATTSDLHQREDIIARLECALQEVRVELDSTKSALRESETRVNFMLNEVESAKREASEARQSSKQAASEQAAALQKAQVAEEKALVSETEMNARVAECVKLEGQVRRFQTELRSMQDRLQDSEEDRANMRDNMQRVKAELAQARDSLAKLGVENSALKQQITKAELEFSGIRDQHRMSLEQIAHQDQILSQIQEDLRQERAKNVEGSRGSAESRRVCQELRDALSNSERQIRDLQNRLSQRDNAVEDAQRELMDCQIRLKAARDELGELEGQLRAAKISHSSAEREAQTVGERVVILEKKINELVAELDRTRDSLRSAQSIAVEREQDAAMLQAELVRTRNQSAELAGQINELNRQIAMMQQETARLRDQYAMNSAQLAKAEEYSIALQSQLENQKNSTERYRELQNRLMDSEQKLAKYQAEAEDCKSEVESIKSKYEEANREIKKLKDALAAEQQENQARSKAEASASINNQNKLTERQREQAHTIAKLSAERDQLFLSLSQAESVLNDKEAKIAEMRNHINEQDHLIRDLVQQCARQNQNRGSENSVKSDKTSSGVSASSASTFGKPTGKDNTQTRISLPNGNVVSKTELAASSKIPAPPTTNGQLNSPKSRRHQMPISNGVSRSHHTTTINQSSPDKHQ